MLMKNFNLKKIISIKYISNKKLFIYFGFLSLIIFLILAIIDPKSQLKVFFSDHHDVFMDFFNTVYYSVGRDPYSWGFIEYHNYLPIIYILFYPISLLEPDYDIHNWDTAYASRENQYIAIVFLIFTMISFIIFFYPLVKKLKSKEIEKILIFTIMFFSAPMLYEIDRANTMLITSGFVFIFLETYRLDKKIYNHLGYICLALAASFKIIPALFGLLLLKERKYKDALFTVVYGLFFSIMPFLFLKGDFISNISGFINALIKHSEVYNNGNFGFSANTIFSFLEFPFICNYIFFVLSVLYIFIHKEFDWKLSLVIFFAYFITTGQQEYYCMILLFYSIILFFNEKNYTTIKIVFLSFFIILLSPVQYNFTFSVLGLNFIFDNYRVYNTLCIVMYIWLISEEFIKCLKNSVNLKKSLV